MHRYRTHTCGELRSTHVGGKARISGWVHRRRDHGGLVFIDLRDNYGLTQCVVEPDSPAFKAVDALRSEFVATFTGRVVARPGDTVNKELATGEVEMRIDEVEVQGTAGDLPLPVFGDQEYPEEVRLTYRFLDLRRDRLHKNILLRSNVITSLRRRMVAQGFTEFQTPILTASSPEGARDFLVPSRLHPGKFYALPQAPQQFKQLIMVAGFDRYFQIAPCFRDEDARADRSPGEFYQLDLEMSFVTQEDVFAAVEPVLRGTFEEFANGRTINPGPFPRIPYAESMLRYGSDKPDLRNPIRIADVTHIFADPTCQFQAFKKVVQAGGVVRAIPAYGAGKQPRSFFDRMNEWARSEFKAPGLGYIVIGEGAEIPELTTGEDMLEALEESGDEWAKKRLAELRHAQAYDHSAFGETFSALKRGHAALGPIAKFIPRELVIDMALYMNCKPGDAIFFAADKEDRAAKLAGAARTRIGNELQLKASPHYDFHFCWIVDFPMYEWNEEEKKIDFSHNPFSMPNFSHEAFLKLDKVDEKTILGITAFQYDIVCNGIELSSGAIRNHKPEIMIKAFDIAGYPQTVVEEKFGGMLNAFRYGAPPHGGTAPGVDRIVMLIAGEENLREVTMFPMNQKAEDLMIGAPSEPLPKQLREANIRVVMPEAAKG